jgi:hypothetical protein
MRTNLFEVSEKNLLGFKVGLTLKKHQLKLFEVIQVRVHKVESARGHVAHIRFERKNTKVRFLMT